MMRRLIAALAMLGVCGDSWADEFTLPTPLRKVAFDQHLNEQVPLDLHFTDETGKKVALGDYFGHGKPVILVLGYYRCPMLCSQVCNGLIRSMLDMDLRLGTDFDVLNVSFDHRETPEMAAGKKTMYLERYGKPGAEAGWHFLTGNEEPIQRLTRAVGYRFHHDADRDQFAHASGIVILTPHGKTARYFYDIQYNPRDLRLGLVEASANRIGSPVDQVLLYCFHYDPEQGRYGVAIMNIVRAAGVLTMAGIALLMFNLWRGERRRKTLAA